MRRTRVLTAVGATALVIGGAVLSVTMAGSAQAATLSSNWYGSAPYVMPLDNNPPDPTTVMAATGQKAFQLAFILAPNGGGCTPTWGGTANVSSDTASPFAPFGGARASHLYMSYINPCGAVAKAKRGQHSRPDEL